MNTAINLADPTVEPTDEQLAGLMQRALAGLAEARAQSLRTLQAEISAAGAHQLREHEGEIEAAFAAAYPSDGQE
jgi:hypothetical protein